MKKTSLQIIVLGLMVMMGCSKDELISDTSESGALKKGSISGNRSVTSISFVGKSAGNDYFFLAELMDAGNIPSNGKMILKNGICSGSISGFGKINPTLSYYSFKECIGKENPEFKITYPNNQINRSCSHMYDMYGTAKICINTSDYFEITITRALLVPYNYEPNSFLNNESVVYGALFGCPMNGQGEAIITSANGKCLALKGRKLEIYNNGAGDVINRVTGEMNLHFRIR